MATDGRFLRLNRAFCELLGYAEEELLAKTFLDITHPDDREENLRAVEQLLAGEIQYVHLEKRYLHKLGQEIWVLVSASLVRDAQGRPQYFISQVQDISQRKQAEAALHQSEEQLRQAQKMEAVGRLAGGVAHDFNNLLTIISGYGEILLRRLGPDDPLHRYPKGIMQASERAASLTQQLLAFSRRQMLEPKVINLNDSVAAMNSMLRRLIGENIDLVTVLEPDLGPVRADPGQIEQVIINLAVNARDAMPEGGKLTIETVNVELDHAYASHHVGVQPGAYALLAITDTGHGMDAETRAHLFEPFFTTKERGKGTGLGLATVYGIVKQSGGTIWVYSEPGRGTTFKVYLPQMGSILEVSPTVPAPEAEPVKGSETILLVEDEETVRALAREVLQEAGFHVLEAQHGTEALTLSGQYEGPIHLLVTDVVMPQMGGRVLADRLIVERPGLKVLYMSGYTDNAIVHQGVLDKGTVFLHKPFSPTVLARKVRELLDAPRCNSAGL